MPRRPRCLLGMLAFAALATLVLAGNALVLGRRRRLRPEPIVAPAEASLVTEDEPSSDGREPEASGTAAVCGRNGPLPEVLIDPAVLIEKSARRLSLLSAGVPVAGYRFDLAGTADGPKERAGDGRTPEGSYYVCAKSGPSPDGCSITISYPGYDEAARGLAQGLIGPREHRAILAELRRMGCPPARTALGGDVRIHSAGGTAHADGGIVLAAIDLAELFDAIPLGTPVDIVG